MEEWKEHPSLPRQPPRIRSSPPFRRRMILGAIGLGAMIVLGALFSLFRRPAPQPVVSTVSRITWPAWLLELGTTVEEADQYLAPLVLRGRSHPARRLLLARVRLFEPYLRAACQKAGVPLPLARGLLATESLYDCLVIDYVFRAGRSQTAHCGLGQLSPAKAQSYGMAVDETTGWRYQQAKQAGNSSRQATYLHRWWKTDERFQARKNLSATLADLAWLRRETGDWTLALLGHHGGLNSPRRAVLKWCRLHHQMPLDPQSNIDLQQTPALVERYRLDYFDLFREKSGEVYDYLAGKSDYHRTYVWRVLAWAVAVEEFLRGREAHLLPAYPSYYEAEMSFWEARQLEHTLLYETVLYRQAADLEKAVRKKFLLPPPEGLAAEGVVVDPEIGQRDPPHQTLYQTAPPRLWGLLRELAARYQALYQDLYRLEQPPPLHVTSLVRTAAYSHGLGGSDTGSHNAGGAADVSLISEGASNATRGCLHVALYEMAQEGKLLYYMEAGGGQVFSTPYNFNEGGHIHLVAAPAWEEYFQQIYQFQRPPEVIRWARWREPYEQPPLIPTLPPEWARAFDPLSPPSPPWWSLQPFSGRWWGETLGPCGLDLVHFLLRLVKLLLALACWAALLLLATQIPLCTYRLIGRWTNYRNPFLESVWERQSQVWHRLRGKIRRKEKGPLSNSEGPL